METAHRTRCLEFVTACRAEYDRLVSQGTSIPGFIITRYKKQFAEVHHKPEIVNVAVEELGGGAAGGSVTHEAAVVGKPRRPTRPSAIVQDVVIDPQRAMQHAPQVVVHERKDDGPPAGMRRAAPLPGAPIPSSPDFSGAAVPARPRKLSGFWGPRPAGP